VRPLAKIDLAEKLACFDERWSPRIVAELNGQQVKLAKLEGSFVWHSHVDADELFLVLQGTLTIELRDGRVELGAGQMVVVPRGVEHLPVADGEVHVLLFEPAGTLNTGSVRNQRTVDNPERI
jgi:mannose-6-phosphate isomerase-like protein (cupin superfamily)